MTKDLKVSEWWEQIAQGLEYRRLYGIEDQWATMEALFYGLTKDAEYNGPNLIQGNGDSLLSQLSVPLPHIMVKALAPSSAKSARMLESVDNSLISELRLGEEAEMSLLHAFLYGRGVWKVGYDSEFGYSPEYDVKVNKESMGASLTQFAKSGRRIEFGGGRPGMPWVKSVLPHDIVVPWGTITERDARWIAHRIVRHVDEIRQDPKYDHPRDLEPVMSMQDFVHSYETVMKPYRTGSDVTVVQKRGTEQAIEYCELWEIHDRASGKVFVIAVGHDGYLRSESDMLQIDGSLPFIGFTLVPQARSYWVTPDAYYLKHYQAELSDIFLQTSKQRRSSVSKFLYQDDAIDDEEVDKMFSVDVGAGVKVKGGYDIDKVVRPLVPPNPNQFAYMDAEQIRRNAREVVGFSRNQAGEYEQTGRRTATEAGIVQQAAGLRMSRRMKKLRDLYVHAMEKVNAIICKFWTTGRWVDVGMGEFVMASGKDLTGDFAYNVTFSAEGDPTIAGRRQEALQLYNLLSRDPNADQRMIREMVVQAFNDPEMMGMLPSPGTGQGSSPQNMPMPAGQAQGGM